MKALFGLVTLTTALAVIGTSIYGLMLAFQAHVALGVIALFVEPAPLILGIVDLVFHKNLAQDIVQYLSR